MNLVNSKNRKIGKNNPVFIIAEVGINHEGSMEKAKQMIDDAAEAGCECVKFQRHVLKDEMTKSAKKVIPGNVKESIWDVMARCALTLDDHKELKRYTESKGMLYLCTPFSRQAADELNSIGVQAFKIGSGECNNYPLIKHIASFGKPVFLSTGMNDIPAIKKAVKILQDANVSHTIFHCVSMYPTPYEKVSLGAIKDLQKEFPGVPIGLSDHSIGIYTSLGAVMYGASIIEKHFTSDKTWPGPDIEISIDPEELKHLIKGAEAVRLAKGGSKIIHAEEQPTIDFAYATVVTTKKIKKGDILTEENIWVKRPGTGNILAEHYEEILGKKAKFNIEEDEHLDWGMFE